MFIPTFELQSMAISVVMWRRARVRTPLRLPTEFTCHLLPFSFFFFKKKKETQIMSSQHISPPPVPVSPPSTGVRRHHTISAASRTARAGARPTISEESQDQQLWNDDEPVDEDWVGGVGAVGEKTSLHRQSSLPTNSKRGPPFPFRPLILSLPPISQPSGDKLQGNLGT